MFALALQRKIHHHDSVLFYDADQQDDADDRHYVEILAKEHESQERSDARRGQRRENRDGVNKALIQYAKHDIHGYERGQDQEALIRERVLEGGGSALEVGLHARRELELFVYSFDS